MRRGPQRILYVILLFVCFCLSLLVSSHFGPVLAATTDYIAYQSKLVRSDGTNITNGTYNFRFRIFTVSSGGTNVWSEDQSLTVTDGVVSAQLGSVTPFGSTVFDNADLYLQICFDANGGTGDSVDTNCHTASHRYEEVFSRQTVTAVPLAHRAKYLTDGLGNSFGANSFFKQSGNAFGGQAVLGTTDANSLAIKTNNAVAMTILSGGNVGIGVSSPTAVLHLKAGTSGAGTAPLKLTSGTLMGTTETGAIEFLTDAYYGTITTGAARKQFAFIDSDITGKSAKTDALNSATTVVNVSSAAAPTIGQVLTATDSTHATWQNPQAVTAGLNPIFWNWAAPLSKDNFTDTNGTILTSHTPDIGPGWVIPAPGVASQWTIQSDQLNRTTNTIAHAYVDVGQSDMIACARFTTLENLSAVLVRRQDAANYWEIFFDYANQAWQMSKVNGGPDVFQGPLLSGTTGTVCLSAIGNTITGRSPNGDTFSVVDSAMNTNTQASLILDGGGGNPSKVDSWIVAGPNTASVTKLSEITILDNGNVGIGDYNPSALFTVGTSDAFQVNASGNITTSGLLDVNGSGLNDIAGTLNLSGNALTSSGALTITPNAGTNFNVALSTTGDFAVNSNQLYVDTSAGNVGVGVAGPTAALHIKAGMTSANTAPLKFTSGPLMSSAEPGAIEFLTDAYYATITTGAARKQIAFTDSSITGTANIAGGTAGAIPYQSAANTTSVLGASTTASRMLLSGASASPTWSTSTIPTSAGATAGRILLSDGTNYVLSTPTFPNASATVGKLIISDGTNWVASTPGYPNASATTRKILVSDGTNFVASTETYATPGTTGNVLVSDGTNWTSASNVAKSTNLMGGNATTLLGAMPYQSNTDTTTLLSPNTSATRMYLTQTGTGTNGAAPVWNAIADADIPNLTGKTYNGLTITANGTNTLNIAAGKTLAVSNSLALAGTDGTTMTFPTTSATLARTDAGNTFTGHQTIEGVTSTGATGTGKLVFDSAPTLTGTITLSSLTTAGLVTTTSGGVLGSTATIGGAYITADALDFTEISDTLTLDASTSIAFGANNLSTTGTGAVILNNSGTFTVAGNIDFNGAGANDIAGTLNLSGNALTSSGALTVTPNAGSNFNIALSGAGDFAVNTSQLYVDTSAGTVGIGTTTPTAKFHVTADETTSPTNTIYAGNGGGTELVTATNDRTFAGAGNWTGTNWSVGSGVLTHAAGNTADAVLANANMTGSSILNGRTYIITFTVTGLAGGDTITPKLGTTSGTAIAADGIYTQTITASADNVNLIFTPTSGFAGSIDNVSVIRKFLGIVTANTGDTRIGSGALSLGNTGSDVELVAETETINAITTNFLNIYAGTTKGISISGSNYSASASSSVNSMVGNIVFRDNCDMTSGECRWRIRPQDNTGYVNYQGGWSTTESPSITMVGSDVTDIFSSNYQEADMIFQLGVPNLSSDAEFRFFNGGGSATEVAQIDESGNAFFLGDVTIIGNDISDSAAVTRITLGGTTTLVNTTTILSGTTALTASSLTTLTTSAGLNMGSTTALTLGSNATVNGGAIANDDLTLQGTSNATRTSSYVLLQPTAGNVGIGNSSPTSLFSVGSTSQFQVNSTGAIAAATGITSSGSITLSGLTTAGLVTTTAGGVLGSVATIGASYVTANSLNFTEFANSMTLDATLTLNQGTSAVNFVSSATSGTPVLVQAAASTVVSAAYNAFQVNLSQVDPNGFATRGLVLTHPQVADVLATAILVNGTNWGNDIQLQNGETIDNDLDGQISLSINGGTSLISVSSTIFNANLSNTITYTQRLCSSGANGATGVVDIGDCAAAGQADYAEYYGTDGSVKAGDIVAVDKNIPFVYVNDVHGKPTSKSWVEKSVRSYQPEVIGIVSTNPFSEILGEGLFSASEHPVPVALAGRIPVNVDPDSEEINSGDFLAASDKSGKAKKATRPGMTIGKALGNWKPGTGKSQVEVFVAIGYVDPGLDVAIAQLNIGQPAPVVGMPVGNNGYSGTSVIEDSQKNVIAKIDTTGTANFSGEVHASNIDRMQELLTTMQLEQASLSEKINSSAAVLGASTSNNLSRFTDALYVLGSASATLESGKVVSYMNVDTTIPSKATYELLPGNPVGSAYLGIVSGLSDGTSTYSATLNPYNVVRFGSAYVQVEEGDASNISVGDSIGISENVVGYAVKNGKIAIATASESLDWSKITSINADGKKISKLLVFVTKGSAGPSMVAVPASDPSSSWSLINDSTLQTPYQLVANSITTTSANFNILKTRTLNVNDLFLVNDQGDVTAQSVAVSAIKGLGTGVSVSLTGDESFTVKSGGVAQIKASVDGVFVNNISVSNKQAGKVILAAGQTSVSVSSSLARAGSVVVVTPSKAVPVSVTETKEGEFTIAIDKAQIGDVTISWILINVEQ